jgi:translocation and assembly module TamB
MRRLSRVLVRFVALFMTLLLVILLLAFAGLNTDPGRRFAERAISLLTGGSVNVSGLSGFFPSQLRLAGLTISDRDGPWITVVDATLNWNPLRLVNGVVRVDLLAARHIDIERLPILSGASGAGQTSTSDTGQASFSLPFKIDVEQLRLDRMEIAPSLIGAPASLSTRAKVQLDTLREGTAELALTDLATGGSYELQGRVAPAMLRAALQVKEPANGLIERIVKVPGLGPLAVSAKIAGPWSNAAADVALSAGRLRGAIKGTLNLPNRSADLRVTADAPAMSPGPDVSWQRIAADLRLSGSADRPQGYGALDAEGVSASGFRADTIRASFQGDNQAANLTASAAGVRIPGPQPDLFASAPIRLEVHDAVAEPNRPATFSLTHPLVSLRGTVQKSAGSSRAAVHLVLPDLSRLAAVAGQELQGRAAFEITARKDGRTTAAAVQGTIGVTGGEAPLAALLGSDAHVDAAGALQGSALTLSKFQLGGRAADLEAHGTMSKAGAISLDWNFALRDLSAISARLQGAVSGRGVIAGAKTNLYVQTTLAGDIGGDGFAPGPVTVSLEARGLPNSPSGTLSAHGTLEGSRLAVDLSAVRNPDGSLFARIGQADWKSAHAEGALSLAPDATLPTGDISLRIGRLADLDPLIGQRIAGRLAATAKLVEDAGKQKATLKADIGDAGLPGSASFGRATLDATVLNPVAAPVLEAALNVSDIRAGQITGRAVLSAKGKTAALALRAQATLSNPAGGDLTASADATADIPAKQLTLNTAQAGAGSERLRLLAPARLDFANGLALDRARLEFAGAVLDLAGRVSPTLDLVASLRSPTLAPMHQFVPSLPASGAVDAQVRLGGTVARPTGTLRLTARDLRSAVAAAASLPAANLLAEATLRGSDANIDLQAHAGDNNLRLSGTMPIASGTALGLRARGEVDLATVNPLLSAEGRSLLGRVRLDATATGTLTVPVVSGTLTLSGGDFQDFTLGAHLSNISAVVQASGETIRLVALSAHAGNGVITGNGTVGLGGQMPVDISIAAHQATPFSDDRLTATIDASLALRGTARQAMAASGDITVDRANFRIPDKLPPSLPVLRLRQAGAEGPAEGHANQPGRSSTPVTLDITVRAPGQVFVRGRGIYAELYGKLHVTGTQSAPEPIGAFRLRRGTLDLAGQTLSFTSGKISFNGGSVNNPSLDLVATSSTNNILATLTVGGTANAPTVTLSSVPPLPQDEILAQLLFHQSAGSLSPLQLAGAVASLAQLRGVGGGSLNPLEGIRRELGLDRLGVGGGQNGTGASVEAGRYVAKGVYAGVRQATTGQGSQATVQIDLFKGLKLEGAVGTGAPTNVTGAGSSADPYGTSIGLTYQFQY